MQTKQSCRADEKQDKANVKTDYIQVLSLEIDREQKKISPCLHLIDKNNTLQELRRIIDCHYVTCTDEALLIDTPVPTLYVNDELVLFGNFVFAVNDNGATLGLNNEDIAILLSYLDRQAIKLYRWITQRIRN